MKQRKSFIRLHTIFSGTNMDFFSYKTPEVIEKEYSDSLQDMAYENYESFSYMFSPCGCAEEEEDSLICPSCESENFSWYVCEYEPDKHDGLCPSDLDNEF